MLRGTPARRDPRGQEPDKAQRNNPNDTQETAKRRQAGEAGSRRGEKAQRGSAGAGGGQGGPGRPGAQRALGAHPAQAGPRILPMQGHGEPLLQHHSAGAFSLKLAGSQSRNLGKRRPNAPGRSAPAASDGFDDHRDEGQAGLLT